MTAKDVLPAEINGTRIVDRAVGHVASKTGAGSLRDALAEVCGGNLEAYLYFRYALAKEAAREVASICDGVNSAFLFLENRCESFPGEPVLLGLVVSRKTAALQSLVDSVCEAVKREVARRIPALASFDSVLSVEIMDSESLSARAGVAALVNSIDEPPIQVWPQ